MGRTGGYAETAADASVGFQYYLFVFKPQGVHLAAIQTGFTAAAQLLVHLRKIIALYRVSRVGFAGGQPVDA